MKYNPLDVLALLVAVAQLGFAILSEFRHSRHCRNEKKPKPKDPDDEAKKLEDPPEGPDDQGKKKK